MNTTRNGSQKAPTTLGSWAMGARFNITNGPSKSRLLQSFEHTYDARDRINAEFTIEVGVAPSKTSPFDLDVLTEHVNLKVIAKIVELGYEDGSGQKFNIAGYIENTDAANLRFKMYYDARRHTGLITILK